MPSSYFIDTERRLVFSRGWGDLTDGEILVTNPAVSSVAQNNPFRRDARRAFVVATDVAFGMVRMFEGYMDPDPEQFRIFREIGPAFERVGLDPATSWPAQKPDATFERP